jgi:hypothetical protein
MNHRWSGWPGAFCLDCGSEDKNEIALADGTIEPGGDEDDLNEPCTEPGSNRHNPYVSATDA